MIAKDLAGFSLGRFPPWHPLRTLRRRLLFDGRPLGVSVNGDDIDHVLELNSFYVIATTYDYFDGCNHWLYLLDQHMKLMDAVSMPDYFGFLEGIERLSHDEITFGYYGTHDKWTLRVERNGLSRYGVGDLLRRPNRFVLKKRYMLLTRTKGPKWLSGSHSSDKS